MPNLSDPNLPSNSSALPPAPIEVKRVLTLKTKGETVFAEEINSASGSMKSNEHMALSGFASPTSPMSPSLEFPIPSSLPIAQNIAVKPVDTSIRFQLIPFSDIPGRSAVGDVVERRLLEGQHFKLGRAVPKDPTQPPPKTKVSELDVFFTSKVVSRVHCEMWVKDGSLYIKDIGSSSGTFLNRMRLSPLSKESRPYPVKEGDIIQLGMDFKGKTEGTKFPNNRPIQGNDFKNWIL